MSILPNFKNILFKKKKKKKKKRKQNKKEKKTEKKPSLFVKRLKRKKGGLSVKLPGNLKIRFFQNFFNSISFYQSRKISTLSNWKFFEN